MLKIRLRRTGARKRPNYRVVVTEVTAPRDGQYIEIIGYYDPLTNPATVRIDGDKAKRWIGQGAQPSDRVAKLLAREGIIEGRPVSRPAQPAEALPEEPAEARSGRARGVAAAAASASASEASEGTEATEGGTVGAGEAGATTEVPTPEEAEAETASAS